MQRVTPDRPWPLHDIAASRAIERRAADTLPTHELMQRAGLAVARLSLALAPHLRRVWIACGPGNNGGDGFEAAGHLHRWGKEVVLTRVGSEAALPSDALASLRTARAAGVVVTGSPPAQFDFAIDAMLGLGSARPLTGAMADWALLMTSGGVPVLAIDVPSGLGADTGAGNAVQASHTLSLLTLKPGLFTASGRDFSGDIWFDDLGVAAEVTPPSAWLSGPRVANARRHDSHKGTYGDVAVIGGADGMTGAAMLACAGALYSGAGRVFVGLLGAGSAIHGAMPELMVRAWNSLQLNTMSVACGCGGGDAVRAALPTVLSTSRALVLDADALNAIAVDTQLQAQLRSRCTRALATVITPHPLEAARLLGASTSQVQADRMKAAARLVKAFGCTVVLKGSGTVIAAPGATTHINPSGNARLATAGTGDVLAGAIAAQMAAGNSAFAAAIAGVYEHGMGADRWPAGKALTASALARAISLS